MDMLIGVVLGLLLGGAITFVVVEKRRKELRFSRNCRDRGHI